MKNTLRKGLTTPTENTGNSNLGDLPAKFRARQKYPEQMCIDPFGQQRGSGQKEPLGMSLDRIFSANPLL